MRTGRPTKPLDVTDEERQKLELLARRPKSSQALAMRARIVLNCATELTNDRVAQKLNVTRPTVGKWRERFRLHRLEGLLDEPRPGAPRSITDDQVEAVVTTTLEAMPKHGTHWSSRLTAKQAGLSQTAIVRIWGAFGLQPHRVEGFKFSKDPQFVEKVRDIVGLYMNPPENALVLCVDEKSQVQALNRTQPILPLGSRRTRAPVTRLRTPWSDFTVHGAECENRSHDCSLPPTPSSPGISAIPEQNQHVSAGWRCRSHRNGQLWNSQSRQGSSVVHKPSPLPDPLHTHERQLAQSRRAALWGGYRALRAPRQPLRSHQP